MKKIGLFFLFLWAQLSALEVLTEAKAAYFIPTDSQFRNIYAKDGVIWGLETTFRAWKHVYPWISVDYFGKSGHSLATHSPTHLYFIPIGAGLKYLYSFERISVYGGLGALPTYLHIHDQSPGAAPIQKNWGCGGIAKVGVVADRLWNFFIDFFATYSFIQISNHSSQGRVEMSPAILNNFSIGAGLGYHFGGSRQETDDD